MRKTDEFSSVFRFRCLGGGPGLDVLAAPNGLHHARLGLIIPKKVVATAVGRNRVKRLLREVFRLRQDELTGMDVVFRLKARLAEPTLLGLAETGLHRALVCAMKRATVDNPTPNPIQ